MSHWFTGLLRACEYSQRFCGGAHSANPAAHHHLSSTRIYAQPLPLPGVVGPRSFLAAAHSHLKRIVATFPERTVGT